MATLQTTQRLGFGECHIGCAVATGVSDRALHAEVFCLNAGGRVGDGLLAGRVVGICGHDGSCWRLL